MLVSYLTNTAKDESNLIRNIQFLINCLINMQSLFGITFVLFLLKLSAGKGFREWIFVYITGALGNLVRHSPVLCSKLLESQVPER